MQYIPFTTVGFLLLGLSGAGPAKAENNFGLTDDAYARLQELSRYEKGKCAYQLDKESGSVTYMPGCDPAMMHDIDERAKKLRTPNAGDFDALNQKLDRIIQLLETHK